MAINPSKLLPTSALTIRGKEKTVAAKPKKGQTLEGQVLIIRTQVIKVEKLISSSYALKYREQKQEERERLKTRRAKREEELEEKKGPKEESKGKLPGLPRLGFLDRIKNFIGNMLLAFFVVRLIDHLPKLVPFVKALGNAADFLIDIGGKLLNGLVTFIDWGYKAYDATKGFVKNLFGEDGAKQFDQLSGLLNKFLNLAIIAGMIAATSGGGRGGGAGAGAAGARSRPGQGGRPKVTTSGGGGVGRPDIRNPLRQRPTVTSGSGGKPKFRLPGAGPKVTGSGAKGILSSVRPFLKRIPLPIIGALIDFGLSVALGENPGRAAFRAIGAGLLGAIGAAAGSVVPVAGNFIGGLLGGFAGDAIGGALYDMFFGGKLPSQKGKTVKKAGGGITRGGKAQGSIRRTGGASKGKIRRKLKYAQKPQEVEFEKPGADIGGEEKLFGIFPNPLKAAQKAVDAINPFKAVENTGKTLGKSDYFGPILAIASKITLGQKPSQQDYQKVGMGINLLFAEGMNKGEIVGGVAAAYAEGGIVDKKTLDAISEKGDITNWVAASFKEATETNAQKTLRELRENADKKKAEPTSSETPPSPDIGADGATSGAGTADTSLNPYRRAFLDTLAYAEGTANYPNTGYNTMFTGKQFSGFKDHPRKIQVSGRYRSDAAGRYQFLSTTWDGLGLPDFSPANQDKGALKLLAPHVLTAIDKGDFATAFHGARKTWASLPGAGYGQPEKKMKTLVGYANNRLAKYKKGEIGKPMTDQIPMADLGDVKGYRVTRSGATIKSYSELPPHHSYQTTSDGRRVQDFTLYKGKNFVNIPVPSPVSGKVTWTGPAGGGGNWVEIQSKEGKVELGHFNKITAKVGQDVQAFKSILGLQGYTGNIRPPGPDGTHVHIQAPDKVVGRYVNTLAKGTAAYKEGGETLGFPHLAKIGEEGTEFVVDADSTAAIQKTFPGFLDAINKGNYEGSIKALQSYASYEFGASETVVVQDTPPESMEQEPMVAGASGMIVGGGDSYDPFAMLDRLPG